MREIKFRAFHENAGMQHLNEDGEFEFSPIASDASIWSAIQDSKITLMQYTGLKDCNGIDIYEGDIIKVVSDIAIDILLVEVHQGNASYCSKTECPLGVIYPTMLLMKKEVIGNIYENPELLK